MGHLYSIDLRQCEFLKRLHDSHNTYPIKFQDKEMVTNTPTSSAVVQSFQILFRLCEWTLGRRHRIDHCFLFTIKKRRNFSTHTHTYTQSSLWVDQELILRSVAIHNHIGRMNSQLTFKRHVVRQICIQIRKKYAWMLSGKVIQCLCCHSDPFSMSFYAWKSFNSMLLQKLRCLLHTQHCMLENGIFAERWIFEWNSGYP